MVKIPNTPDTRQDIVKTDILMERGGYFYAYLVNESSMNVYFDDFQVTHVTGKVLEENHYYPFGLLNAQLSTRPTEKPLNHYKYNGKELQKELNLEWLDYGARFYDAQVGRWHSVDPMAESANKWTPYQFCYNNPLKFIDPDGMKVINGHEEEREEAEEEKRKAEIRFQSLDKEKDKEEWKAAKHELKQKTRQFNKADRNFRNANAAIDELKSVSPEIYTELDNLKGPQGQIIDISVTTLGSNTTYIRDGTEYEMRGGTYAMPGSGSNDSYIIDPISGKKNTIGVKLRVGEGAKIFSHEGGHCVYYSSNVREYYYNLLRQNPSWRTQGGHAPGDPNGISADQMEKRFIEAFNIKRKNQK